MNRFAALLDRLAYEHGRNAKLRLLADHFRTTPDPDRGYALAALTGALTFRHAKPGLIRTLIAERTDPTLFELSYDYVGDLSETVALMWPARNQPVARMERSDIRDRSPDFAGAPSGLRAPSPQSKSATADFDLGRGEAPTLSEVVTALGSLGKTELPAQLAQWLDGLDEVGRWALLKLVTGALRVGISARLAKTAVAALGNLDPDDIEIVWPNLQPPYGDLFAWVEGRAAKPASGDPVPFRPPMLSHAIEEADFAALDPAAFLAEWKWDGIRVQATGGHRPDASRIARLFSRTGEDISASFPDVVDAIAFDGALDGELLIMRDGRVQSFNVLQQRLNRKTVTPKLLAEFPAHLRAYDLLVEGDADLREMPFAMRRARLEALVARLASPRIDLSPLVPFASWEALAAARADPAQAGDELVPVGKAYFGFTDAELAEIDRFVRRNTVNRFGPVREVVHENDRGLVFEVAFEGVARSARHKSGIAMRFPRISRLRFDKPPRDADRLERLEALLERRSGPQATAPPGAGAAEQRQHNVKNVIS